MQKHLSILKISGRIALVLIALLAIGAALSPWMRYERRIADVDQTIYIVEEMAPSKVFDQTHFRTGVTNSQGLYLRDDMTLADAHFKTSLQKDWPSVMHFSILMGADPLKIDQWQSTPLFDASAWNADQCAYHLLRFGLEPNRKDKHSQTPLHAAAFNDADRTAQLLLRFGAEPNLTDTHGLGPLHVTAKRNSGKVAKILIENGADTQAVTRNRNSPLKYAMDWRADRVLPLLGVDPEILEEEEKKYEEIRASVKKRLVGPH